MLNYSVHAIEQFNRLDLLKFERDDAEAIVEIKRLLHAAVKFTLPENGSLFGDDYHKGYDVVDHTLLHLPFPIMALEYPFSMYDPGDTTNLAAPKRIALCLDYAANKYTLFGRQALRHRDTLDEVGGIILIVLCTMGLEDRWLIQPFGVVIPGEEIDDTKHSIIKYTRKDKQTAKIGFMPMIVMTEPSRRLMELLGPDKAINNGLKDCGEEVNSLVGLLAALSCSNVKTHTEPAPVKLNAKRVKNGKLPFFEYKVVMVDTVASPGQRDDRGRFTAAGRQSPREHLRRGHIRRLSVGRNVWVQSAIIGSSKKGYINKSYAVKGK